jgi:hypothetical protein
VTATRALTLTTTKGMVDWVHRNTTVVRALAFPAITTRFTNFYQRGFGVTN